MGRIQRDQTNTIGPAPLSSTNHMQPYLLPQTHQPPLYQYNLQQPPPPVHHHHMLPSNPSQSQWSRTVANGLQTATCSSRAVLVITPEEVCGISIFPNRPAVTQVARDIKCLSCGRAKATEASSAQTCETPAYSTTCKIHPNTKTKLRRRANCRDYEPNTHQPCPRNEWKSTRPFIPRHSLKWQSPVDGLVSSESVLVQLISTLATNYHDNLIPEMEPPSPQQPPLYGPSEPQATPTFIGVPMNSAASIQYSSHHNHLPTPASGGRSPRDGHGPRQPWTTGLCHCCCLTCWCPCIAFGRIAEIVDRGSICTVPPLVAHHMNCLYMSDPSIHLNLWGERVALRTDGVGVGVLVYVLVFVQDQAKGSVLAREEAVRGLLRPLLVRVVLALPRVPRAPEPRLRHVYRYRD
ncbi:hypothetical protein SAY86_031480 [Trapa natans]|uniref:Uncharacterized protein n=1 Tax=Trapa natans TaxID=22666 RepID=A0AAN7LS10_TRANT|nr:hypothetical protein SAY86_031480 [Trapa natans]